MATRPIIRIKAAAFNGDSYLLVLQDRDRGELYLYLSTLDWKSLSDVDLYAIHVSIASDGCTGVPDFYLGGCVIHDFHYATHRDFDNLPITRAEADRRLRQYIQTYSAFGLLSPMSWWRWAAVRILGGKLWNKQEW